MCRPLRERVIVSFPVGNGSGRPQRTTPSPDVRILQVIPSLASSSGGPATAVIGLSQGLAQLGHDVTIVTTDRGRKEGVRSVEQTNCTVAGDGSAVIRVFPTQFPSRWATSREMLRFLRTSVREFDIVHIHSLFLFPTWAAGHACRRAGVPYVVELHGVLDPYHRRKSRAKKALYYGLLERRNLAGASAIRFATYEERRLASLGSLARASIVIPHGTDVSDGLEDVRPGAFRESLPELGTRSIVLFLGRLAHQKGLDLLAEAFIRGAHDRRDSHLVIAGPDPEDRGAALAGQFESAGIGDRVSFVGELLGHRRVAALRDADLLVLPSYSENFGIVAIEALAAGTPVVVSDRVNLAQDIADAGAGIVVPCEPIALARSIVSVLSDAGTRTRMSKNGRRLVDHRYRWPRIAGAMAAAYGDVIRGATTMMDATVHVQ